MQYKTMKTDYAELEKQVRRYLNAEALQTECRMMTRVSEAEKKRLEQMAFEAGDEMRHANRHMRAALAPEPTDAEVRLAVASELEQHASLFVEDEDKETVKWANSLYRVAERISLGKTLTKKQLQMAVDSLDNYGLAESPEATGVEQSYLAEVWLEHARQKLAK